MEIFVGDFEEDSHALYKGETFINLRVSLCPSVVFVAIFGFLLMAVSKGLGNYAAFLVFSGYLDILLVLFCNISYPPIAVLSFSLIKILSLSKGRIV